jgi:hypothetical protein
VPCIFETPYTAKPQFIIPVGGPEKEQWICGNNRCEGLYKIRFVQGQQRLNDVFREIIHLETID